ncbi:MAG TPA: SCP2 sterol-binding domain-containing protein [Mycobacteriales bacterium]|nr:SCP2 sterol-binding domain-containing protein [Mycobacteriales bacterium]
MASVEQCEQALHVLSERLAAVDPETRAKYVVERTVSCRIRDLDVVFVGRIDDAGLSDIRRADDTSAQVRLATTSDDLLALADGRLGVPAAWATGRLKIEASVLDLLKLRSLL